MGRCSAPASPSWRPIKGNVELRGRQDGRLQLMRRSLGGYPRFRMRKILLAALSSVTLACSQAPAAPGPEALCLPGDPPENAWQEVEVPATNARVRLPREYQQVGERWRAPDGSQISFGLASRLIPDPADDGLRLTFGPLCRMQLGQRVIGFTAWAEFQPDGGLWHGSSASWEELPGIIVAISATAQRPKRRWEQLRILHSLR